MTVTKPVPKVLVVEDDPIMLGLLELHLSRAGYQVFSAKDAKQGLALAVQHQPSVILLDVLMPESSGLAVLRQLRQTESTSNIAVIVISVDDHPEAMAEAMAAGAKAFLVKPFGLGRLLGEVRRAFGHPD